MNYDSSIHSKAFLPKTILGNLNFFFKGFPHKAGDLLVLNYHSTPSWLNREFENQVNFLLQHFDAIHPDELKSFYSRQSVTSGTTKKPSLLFTFDDGLKNNLNAAKILEKSGVKGLFFIVPDFFNTAESEQQNYYQTHIRKIINPRVDNQKEDLTALSIREMTDLVSRGHVMGSHSMSHTMSANDSDGKQVVEIVESKKKINAIFGVPVQHFCAPFDSLRSTGKQQMKLIKANYDFFHSTFPGSNSENPDPYFIRRVNVESFWPLGAVKFACSGMEWKRWQKQREEFNTIIQNH